MSRVFEALEKASKEKTAVHIEPTMDQPMPKSTAPVGKGNGIDHPPVRQRRSWRETTEEFLFGRDLRSYKNYPIIPLEKGSPAAEQYKILREQVRKLRANANARVISVTSPIKSDGKSMVAANLAAALALEHGDQVLLLDCDLRNPQVHQYFNISRTPGLADYLTAGNNGNFANFIQGTSLGALQVLPAGKATGVSSELLATDKMRNLIDQIRLKFPDHQIIVDSPPILSTPDPLILANHVDGILMVIRAGKTPRDCLAEAVKTLNSNKIMGVVLNGTELGITSKYYYY